MQHTTANITAPNSNRRANPEDLAREVICQSSVLGGQLHPISRQAVIKLLRITNSYYSNIIEGLNAHPVDVEQAMTHNFSNNPCRLDHQKAGLAHINCQLAIESRLRNDPTIDIAGSDFICWVHRSFYEQLPFGLRQLKNEKTGEQIEVIPGEFRHKHSTTPHHCAPSPDEISDYLARFTTAYSPNKHHGIMPIIATAASHHRLMWLNPFAAGSGHVVRFYTEACFQRLPLNGFGLWNISRGIAKQLENYHGALGFADTKQSSDVDEQGMSSRARLIFCRFFIGCCLGEIRFMQNLLELDGLLARINGYIAMRGAKLIKGPGPDFKTIKHEATYMLQEVLLRGEMKRGDLVRSSGMSERSGRMLLSQLLKEKLLTSDTPKGAVRINLSCHVAAHLFPDLFPALIS